jgi:hypothetical protein
VNGGQSRTVDRLLSVVCLVSAAIEAAKSRAQAFDVELIVTPL